MTDKDPIDVEVVEETRDEVVEETPAPVPGTHYATWQGRLIRHPGAESECEFCHPADEDLGDDPDGDIEGYDGGFTHPDVDPEMTSGIAMMTPEQYIERTRERREAEAEQLGVYTFSREDAQLAVVADNLPELRVNSAALVDQIDYQEDYGILRVLFNKLFRRAIIAGAELPEMPDIAEQVGTVGDLTEVLNDLNDARDGKDEVSWQLTEWKAALAE